MTMSAPDYKPDPPAVGKVTQRTIELKWDWDHRYDEEDCGGGRKWYCVQEEEKGKRKGFGTVYNGFAMRHVFRGLNPGTTYHYRVRVCNDLGNSPWSTAISVTSTSVPVCGEDVHKAIINWEVEKVKKILNDCNNSLVDVPNAYGMSPLMIASQKGYTSIVEVLVEHGADVNYTNSCGKTSMMLACFGGHLNVASYLLEHGALLGYKDNGGSSALHWAVDGDKDDCVKWLLRNGMEVDEDDLSGWSPLIRLATIDGSVDVAKVLLEYGASVNRCDKFSRTSLMAAALNGNEPLCRQLVESGADLAMTSQYGRTPLDFAESFDRRDVVLYLEKVMCKEGTTRTCS